MTTIDFQNDLNYINKVLAETGKESDRAAAVLIGAEIDNVIVKLLQSYFLPPMKKSSKLIEQEGPLGTFSARIEVLYRLGLIPPVFHHDLQIMRGIRNDFAHGSAGLTFNTDSIRDRCKNLLLAEDFRKEKMADPNCPAPDTFCTDARSRFFITSSQLLAQLTLLKYQLGKTPEHWRNFFKPIEVPPEKNENEQGA